jgi:transcription antitermination factor NusG
MEYTIQDNPINSPESSETREKNWFVLQVRPQAEQVVAALLKNKGYEQFLPLYKSRRKWSDRIKQIDMPLFPGYVFCRMTSEIVGRAVTTPGVIRIVGNRKVPIPVEESEISAIQKIVESSLEGMPIPYLAVGQKVRIRSGPLMGAEGIVVGNKGGCRLVVSVGLLLRSVSVEIDRGWLN